MEHDKKKEKKAVEEKETPPCKYGYQGQFNRVLLLEPMQYSGTQSVNVVLSASVAVFLGTRTLIPLL
jgi:hypothetical protein